MTSFWVGATQHSDQLSAVRKDCEERIQEMATTLEEKLALAAQEKEEVILRAENAEGNVRSLQVTIFVGTHLTHFLENIRMPYSGEEVVHFCGGMTGTTARTHP